MPDNCLRMRFEGIEFPSPILEAQEKEELVVFAGAGVSVPAPSRLPNFKELAKELATGTVTFRKDEPIDRFLGKLPESLNIYERTSTLLQKPGSKPNPLHCDLLRVFLRSSAVRLVTTNFDDHFATAALNVFPGDPLEMFFAPALPVGGNFQGLVHLHGSVKKDPRRMVLTDRDFGKAYLTEGWARRFVLDLFLRYTVLFIGYSHNDPVMHYLARGLPPNEPATKRYALGLTGSEAFWENLGIILLPYSKRRGRNQHIQLQIACTRWAERMIAAPLESREQIRIIVEKPPQPAGEEIDLIEQAFRDIVLLRFFTEFATSVEWLDWASNRDAFNRLFQLTSNTTECDRELAWWFARKYAVNHAGFALDLIRRRGSAIPPLLWGIVAHSIWMEMKSGVRVESLSKWVPLLIANHPDREHTFLEYILSECRFPEDSGPALLLFSHLVRPVIQLKESISRKVLNPDGEPDVSVDLKTRGDRTYLAIGWKMLSQSDFSPHVHHLIAMATSHLEEATLLYEAYNADNTWWDPISIHLPKLDRPNITLTHNGLSVLVDVARESLSWILQNQPERTSDLIEAWASGKSLTLRRLAVSGAARTGTWTPDQKLAWLLRGDYVYMPGFSVEVLEVLGAAFSSSSPDLKMRIVERVIEGPRQKMEESNHDGFVFTLLLRLDEFAPGDPLVTDSIAALRQRRPEFGPPPVTKDGRLLTFLPPWERLPFDANSLQAEQPENVIGQLLTFNQEQEGGPDRGDVIRVVRQAVLENLNWGFDLADALCNRGAFDTDLWKGVIPSVNQLGLEIEQWFRILNLLIDHPRIVAAATDEAVNLLEQGIMQESNGINGDLLPLAARVGLEAWSALLPREWARVNADDWLTIAINDSAGTLMQFELRAAALLRRDARDDWKGLPPELQNHFSAIIRGDSWSAAMARIVLASQVRLLFSLDPEWTASELIDLFNWDADLLRAQQAWHGYLVWGEWTDELLVLLLPWYVATFTRLHQDLGKFSEQFCEHMAAIATLSNIDPLKNGWLHKFIRTAVESDRVEWARSIAEMLKRVPEEKRKDVWDRWINSYWKLRLEGIPQLLSGQEVAGMLGWLLHLDGAFPDAVNLLLRSPAPISRDNHSSTYLYMALNDSRIENLYPDALARCILHLLKSDVQLPFPDPIDEMVQRLIPTAADRNALVGICERLAEFGYGRAATLKLLVESSG